MKKLFIAFIAFLSPLYNVCFASGSNTNAELVNYAVGKYDHNYFLIIPDNVLDYEYLSHYPFTALMFLKNYDEEKISKITVKELNSGSLGSSHSFCASNEYYDVLKFDKIRGFESIAKDLETVDEFGIAERKAEIISALLNCFSKYKQEYKKYLQGIDGFYKFRKGKFRFIVGNPLKEYNDNVEINQREGPFAFYDQIDISHYDFDNKVIKIEPLSPYSKLSSSGWEYHYIRKIKKKYRSQSYKNKPALYHKDFPKEVQVPVTIDDAKELFADRQKVYSETILTVIPKPGYFGYSGKHFFVMTSNFEIKKITKNYYKRISWSRSETKFVGEPVFTIVLESNDKHLFH